MTLKKSFKRLICIFIMFFLTVSSFNNIFAAQNNTDLYSDPITSENINLNDTNNFDEIYFETNNDEVNSNVSLTLEDTGDVNKSLDNDFGIDERTNIFEESNASDDITSNDNNISDNDNFSNEENITKEDILSDEELFINNEIEEEQIIFEEKLNAEVTPLTYTITYILNGGENHIDNISTLKNNIKFVLKSPKRAGYTFAGWYNKADNTRVKEIKNENMTVYAKWNPITYIVNLVPNGGTYTVPTSNKIEYTNMSSKINLPIPVRQYYTFGGWYKDKTYTQKIDYIYSGSIGNMTLYAKWNPITHNIRYYMNDTSTEPVILSSKHITSFNEATSATLISPTRTGFVFNGFYETNPNSIYFTGKEKKVIAIPKFTQSDKTLYAKWTENKYKLVYNANGGAFSAPISALSLKYTETTRTPLYTALKAREGYTFLGWNTKKDGTGINYGENVSISRLTAKNGTTTTLYANWKAIEYGVYCDYRGGSMFDSKGYPLNPRTHTIEKNITLKNPTKTGYIFGGWYRTKDCSGKKSTVIPKSTSEENFYALWTPIKYSITFNANGGVGKVSSLAGCEYDKNYVIKENLFTKKINSTTFSFKEWNTKPDGTGISYMPGDVVSNLTTKNKGIVKLYAIWVKN